MAEQKGKLIREGKVFKGGKNPKPTGTRPISRPAGQNPQASGKK